MDKKDKVAMESPLAYDFDKFTWLAQEWFKLNGSVRYPNRQQIVNGVIVADREEIKQAFPKVNKFGEKFKKFVTQRENTWNMFFKITGFMTGNMDAPIEQG